MYTYVDATSAILLHLSSILFSQPQNDSLPLLPHSATSCFISHEGCGERDGAIPGRPYILYTHTNAHTSTVHMYRLPTAGAQSHMREEEMWEIVGSGTTTINFHPCVTAVPLTLASLHEPPLGEQLSLPPLSLSSLSFLCFIKCFPLGGVERCHVTRCLEHIMWPAPC